MRRARLVVAALAVALLVALPQAASAAYKNTPAAVLKDCGAGHYPLKGHYTIKVLQEALKRLDSYGAQYTNCGDVITETINHLELAPHPTSTARGTHPRTSRGNQDNTRGSTPKVVRPKNLKQGAGLPVVLPGTNQTVTPGEVTASGASFLSSLPTPLLAILAALLAVVLAVSARAINNIVRTRRSH
ncbi:MAG: hypothetical protein ABR947_02775 [Solirubrobacteraceae bacterium]|jgi:hypothetical protein